MKINKDNKNTFYVNGRHRKRAFLLIFIYVSSIMLNFIPISSAASPPNSFYISLKTIHMDNPKWTYEEFVTRINEISDYTLSRAYNDMDDWINPYVYEKYDQLVVYGLPHGKTSPTGTTTADFFINSNGGMFNIESKKQGEYRHIGYNLGGISVTNDYWHNTSYTGTGTFSTKEDYTDLAYTTISGASASWNNVDAEMRNYILNSYFNDDDYITGGKTPFTLSSLWSDDFISNHVLIQVEPGIVRQGSLKMIYNNGKNHNTLTIDPFDFSFSGNLTTDKNTYTIPAGQNEVIVDIKLNAAFANSIANDYLKDVEFTCMVDQKNMSEPQNISVTPGEKNYKAEGIKKTFSRSNLQTGSNPVKIEGIIQVNSNYKDYQNVRVSKDITIIVEENPDPWVTAIMTATPKTREFIGGNIPVKLDIAYGIANIKNANLINDIVLTIPGEGTFTKTPMLVGEHTLNAIIPASYMTGYDTRNKTYSCNVKYNMKDGNSYAYDTSAVVHIISNVPKPGASPTPTPTPIPINQNSPPYVMLDAPASVKAGERFKVTAKGNDNDGDILAYYWDVNYATTAISSTTYKYLWYDQIFANSVQEVYCEVSDGEDIGADLVAISVKEPSIDALMNITGTLKENRKITLNDVSQSPEFYPITNRQWTITPISGIVAADIKTDGNLTGVSEDITIKGSGVIRVSLWVKNSAGYEKTISRTLNIAEDLPPVADLSTVTVNFRDPDHSNISTFEVTNKCYSPDNDKISRIMLKYRYDSNNNGSFTDEAFVTVYDGVPKNKILVDVNQVGKYEFYIEAQEEFGQSYISSYVTSADKLKNNKLLCVEVINFAPSVSVSMKEKKSIDININIRNNISNDVITTKLNQYVLPELISNNIEVNFNIIRTQIGDKVDPYLNGIYYFLDDYNDDYFQIGSYNIFTKEKVIYSEHGSSAAFCQLAVGTDGNLFYVYNKHHLYSDNVDCYVYNVNVKTGAVKQVIKISGDDESIDRIKVSRGNTYIYILHKGLIKVYKKSGSNYVFYDDCGFGSSNTNDFDIAPDGKLYYPSNYLQVYDPVTKECDPAKDSDGKRVSLMSGKGVGISVSPEGIVYTIKNSKLISYNPNNGQIVEHIDIPMGRDTTCQFIEASFDNKIYLLENDKGSDEDFSDFHGCWTSGHSNYLREYKIGNTSSSLVEGNVHTISVNSTIDLYYRSRYGGVKRRNNGVNETIFNCNEGYTHRTNCPPLIPKGNDFNIDLTNSNWTNGDKYYVCLSDVKEQEFISTPHINMASNYLKKNDIHFIGIASSDSKNIMQNFIAQNDNKGIIIENNNLDSSFIQLANYIINNTNLEQPPINKYVEIDKDLIVESYYDDYENDPQYSVRYKYNHDPNYFENGLGYANNMGVYVTTPMLCFSKPGLYEMDIQARDNPKNNAAFDNYRLWSYPRKMTLYVHRPPVPVFTVNAIKSGTVYNVSYAENSYDLDHLSRDDKGIVNKRWFYKESSSPTWIEGKLPSSIAANKTYQVKLDVMDMEFSWASSVQVVSTVPVNHNPIAQFYFKSNPASKYDYTTISNVIVDTSIDPDGDTITERRWTVKKGSVVQPNGINTILNTAGEGKYEVTLEVKDSKSAWSTPYTQTLTVVGDIAPPTISLTPAIRPWGNTNVAVTMNCADTGGSGLKEVRYLWTENPDFADGEFTTVATVGNVSRTQTANGNWYLYAQTVDNAGNASNIIRGGPYQVDKAAPTLLDYKVISEDYRVGNTFWIAKNKSVDVYIKALEQLSGMRYTYLRVPQGGDNRASHDWNGNATNLNEFDTSTYTDITAAERTLSDLDKGEYEVRFTLKGLNDIVSDLQYYFTDKVGNIVGYNNSGYKIGVDTLPPVITITPGQRDLGKTEITASVSVSDSGSGVKESKYIVSTSATKPAAGAGWTSVLNTNFNVDITGTGTWYLHVESIDNVGNVSSTRAGSFKVDLEGPVITANPINRIWDNSNVLISLTTTEAYSALKEVRYSITNNTGRVYGGWQHVNANQNNTIEIIENGTWYVHVEGEDIAGNVTYTYFGPYRVDKEAPVLTMGYVGGARYVSGNNYFAKQGDTVTFWMQGVDAHSGMWRLFALARDGVTDPYRAVYWDYTIPTWNDHSRIYIDSPQVSTYTGKTFKVNFPFNVLTPGDYTYRIEGIADDNATYNRHGWVDKGYRLITDNTAPILSADVSSGTFTGHVEVNLSSVDNGSGVKNISYAWSDKTTAPATGWNVVSSSSAVVTNHNEGVWYLYVRSADNVDNISLTQRFGSYEVVHLSIDDVTIEGYWNHWRGQVDKFDKPLTNEPHRFLSLETVKITVKSSGADKVIIRFSPELEDMQYIDKFGNTYDYSSDFNLEYVNFPNDSTFILNPTDTEQTTYWEYTLPLADSSLDNDNIRLNPQYKMIVTAYRESNEKVWVIEDIDITGNIYDNIYIQEVK